MSEVQMIMNLEVLPNEILIECFEYLNAPDIFYSFDQLNYRFSTLIRTLSLHLNCQYVRKLIFDQFCTKILSTTRGKNQIRSLCLSNKNTCVSIKIFLSFFILDEFPHLRSLTLTNVKENNVVQLKAMLPLLLELTCFRLLDTPRAIEEPLSIVLTPKLRTLAIPTLYPIFRLRNEILPIKSLTISDSSLDDFDRLFRCVPMLQYLNVRNIYKKHHSVHKDKCYTDDHVVDLKQLMIKSFTGDFDDLSALSKRAPNLKSLTIFDCSNKDMISACRWEDLITSSLPQLVIFKFKFRSSDKDYILNQFQQFQTDFWQEQHHWYTEYISYGRSAQIYTIPYISNTYIITPHIERYSTQSLKNTNTFDNVSDLTLYQEGIKFKDSYYFHNVKSLTFEGEFDPEDTDDYLLKTEHMYFLKMMVNLSNLKHLTIPSTFEMESPSVFLQLLKQASQLSSISIELDHLQSFFHDDELCKHFNKMITRLDIYRHCYKPLGNPDKRKKFCEIFSNLEQLICHINEENDLVFLLIHLRKLSLMKIQSKMLNDHKSFIRWLEETAQKFNLIIHTEFENDTNHPFLIWIDRNIH